MRYYELDAKTAVIMMYCGIGNWEASARSFSFIFEELDSKYANIIIRMHCEGGSVFEGNVIYNCIANRKSKVTIRIDGMAASMATIVMLPADEIEIAENGLIMFHRPSTYTSGNATQLQGDAKLLLMMEKNFKKGYARKTKRPEKEIDFLLDGNDHWMDADEALEFGIVDRIIPAVAPSLHPNKPSHESEASAVYSRFESRLIALAEKEGHPLTATPANQPTASIKIDDTNMKKLLIAALALTGLTEANTDAEVMAAVQAKMGTQPDPNATSEAVVAAVEQATGHTFEADARKQLLEIGAKAGIPAMQMTMNALLRGNAGAAPAAIATIDQPAAAAVPAVVTMLGKGGAPTATGRESWNWEQWQKEDPDGLSTMAAKDYAKFNAIYKAEFKTDAPK